MSTTIEFGKHKGQKWSDLPTPYLRWLVSEIDRSKDAWTLAKTELERRGNSDGDQKKSGWELRQMTPTERADLKRRIEENNRNPQPLKVVQVDLPYKSAVDDIFRGRWVVLVVESNRVTRLVHEHQFDSEEEAQAYYQEMKAGIGGNGGV